MYRIVEPLGWRSLNELGARRKLDAIVRSLAVRAPVTLVRTGVRVEDDDAVVEVSIGHEQFVGLLVHEQAGRSPQVTGVVAAFVLPGTADLQEELPLRRELQNMVVFLGAA